MITEQPFENIELEDFALKPFSQIRYKWLLITAGTKNSFNSMTACWGGLGHLWDDHHVCFVFVRPSRYTYEFLEESVNFTIQFFDQKYQEKLRYLGTNSGRDKNKIDDVGFTQLLTRTDSVYFKEADTVFDCRKIYYQDVDPDKFLDPSIGQWYEDNYPEEGYHRMYVGSIQDLLVKKA